MEFRDIIWNGFSGVEFDFMGQCAKVIKPNCTANGKWVFKTEYFDAFPDTQIEFLNRGWHLVFNKNDNRWAEDYDLERKVKLAGFVSETFGLDERFVPLGMSCGGLYSVKLAALIPEKIGAIYLDAPVMNLLSCPFGFGNKSSIDGTEEEYVRFTGRTKVEMLSYREHPIDKMPILLENDIPIVLVAGDSDDVVPYEENGALLERFYKQNGGRICVHLKAGCNHHPHGLEDVTVAVDEIEKYFETRK
jgi:pimeloyl-ACP methyl ester carboxylesterase